MLPLLYLHGLSTGDLVPTLEQFLGSTAGLSPATVSRLTAQWTEDHHKAFQTRDLSKTDSGESWANLLRDAERRGMRAPVLAVGEANAA